MDEKLEQLKDLWPCAKELENTRLLITAQAKAKIYTVKIRESWLLLHKDKQIKCKHSIHSLLNATLTLFCIIALNFHEEQLHQLEKYAMLEYN